MEEIIVFSGRRKRLRNSTFRNLSLAEETIINTNREILVDNLLGFEEKMNVWTKHVWTSAIADIQKQSGENN